MKNNAPGGVGNDLGLDDITFRAAGPAITVTAQGFNSDTFRICNQDQRDLKFSSTVESCIDVPAYQWEVSTNNGTSWTNIAGANGLAYTRTPTAIGKYLYRLTVAQAANIGIATCRVSSLPISVEVTGPPAVTITGGGAICAGNQVTLTTSGAGVFSWSGPNGFVSTSAAINIVAVSKKDSGIYRITVTDSAGCKAADSTVLRVEDRPVADFTNAGKGCMNSTVQFTDRSLSGGAQLVKWSWDFGDGNVAAVASPAHSFQQAGNYQVSLYVENDAGCSSDTIKKTFAVHPSPVAAFGMPAICLTDPFAQFSDSSTIADGSVSQLIYAWNFGDDRSGVTNPNTSTQKDPRHVYSATGLYQVQLTVTSKDGCSKDTARTFTVNGAQPVAVFSLTPGTAFCSDSLVALTNHATVDFGNITRVDIFWDYQNNPNDKTTDSFPASGRMYEHNYPSFGNTVTKNAVIRYIAYSGIGCMNTTDKDILLKASPKVAFDSLSPVCESENAFILNQAHELNGLAGNSIYSGLGVTEDSVFNPVIAGLGNHLIHYLFSTSNGCNASADRAITVLAKPSADAGPDQVIISGGSAMLAGSSNGTSPQFEWTPNVNIDNNQIATPVVSPATDIVYTLQVTSAEGCTAEDQVSIKVVKDMYVPKAFSPNGDGLNDNWRINLVGAYTGGAIDVFNRFGNLVFHSTGPLISWDGKFKGEALPQAAYVWVIRPLADGKVLHGTVMLIR